MDGWGAALYEQREKIKALRGYNGRDQSKDKQKAPPSAQAGLSLVLLFLRAAY